MYQTNSKNLCQRVTMEISPFDRYFPSASMTSMIAAATPRRLSRTYSNKGSIQFFVTSMWESKNTSTSPVACADALVSAHGENYKLNTFSAPAILALATPEATGVLMSWTLGNRVIFCGTGIRSPASSTTIILLRGKNCVTFVWAMVGQYLSSNSWGVR